MALTLALGLYLLWVLATYLLEGRIHTLLRPEAMGARLSYALVANILIGIGGSALVIRFLSSAGTISTEQAGFRDVRHAAVAVAIGVVLGFAFYALQGAPSWNPIVIINAYAQVLVGTVAEILVCWAVVGSVSQALLQDRGRWVSTILAALIASVLFGIYHFAHSPPFNTIPVVLGLSVVGLVTSAFFFVSRDVYGTMAFHNFLGIFGVLRALDASGNLSALERPVIPLLVMAVVAIAALIAVHVLWINPGAAPTPPRVR
ncbi:MAG TPA: CPBP family glutamic-type intramembrane protease [Rubrobacter sp.]|nr:CPBP family glutamic-type intramembrane protease [Rubrobacter sp.]